MSELTTPNPDVQIAALWVCYRSAQRDGDLYRRRQSRQHLHLIACACPNQTIRVMARAMLRTLIAQTNIRATNPIEAPCA